jgi:NAD+ diphosphatase
MLPESYLSPLHLPFNQACLDGAFEFRPRGRDPGGAGYWLLVQGGDLAVVEKTGDLGLPDGNLPDGIETADSLYIGQWQGRPCRVVALGKGYALPAGYALRGLTSPVPQISIELLSLGGLARQVLYWHDNSRFCSRCGCEQQWLTGEWGKLCPECESHHFPHIHPCVIVVVRRPGEILMTRKAGWAEGRYSLVAGFLDMGECLEEAVVREVREETGVEIDNVRYIGSQSWPFPSQLMTGFVADYAGGEIRIEEKELEDVRWFPVDDLPKLPPKRSISRYLIDNFKNKD